METEKKTPDKQPIKDDKVKKKKEKTNYFPFVILVVGIVAIAFWLANWFALDHYYCNVEQRGQFGDRFGMSTSLFGAFTIILLLYTIHLQRKEIDDGKKEFKQQNRTLRYQRFDNTFFNMINLHLEIIRGIPAGRQSFKDFIEGRGVVLHILCRRNSSVRTLR